MGRAALDSTQGEAFSLFLTPFPSSPVENVLSKQLCGPCHTSAIASATLAQTRLDPDWIDMVGWKQAGTLPPNANWASLSDADQASLQEVSWNWFVREYLTAGLKAIRQALPPTVSLGAWCVRSQRVCSIPWMKAAHSLDLVVSNLNRNWPFKFWTLPPGGLPRWNAMMDEMGWLWQLMDVFIPDVYPEFYSGSVESRPTVLSNCKAENASTTSSYFQSNVDVAVRLRNAFNPSAKIVLSAWWHYMCASSTTHRSSLHQIFESPPRVRTQQCPPCRCAQGVTDDEGYFVHDGNLAALFGVEGADGIALWGSVGDSRGEDANASHVVDYLNRVWQPLIASHCAAAPSRPFSSS